MRSPHVHRGRASQTPHAIRLHNVGFNFFGSQRLQLAHLGMCAQVESRVLERILIGDNDPSMRNFGAGATCGSVEDVLVRSTRGGRSAGWLPRLLSGGFGAHASVLFDAGSLGPMHGRSGAAGRTCFDCKPSIGTRVSLSVSAFGGCSFALGVQHV